MLLEFGANLNLLDHDRWTPLHMAAACGNIEMTEFLLEVRHFPIVRLFDCWRYTTSMAQYIYDWSVLFSSTFHLTYHIFWCRIWHYHLDSSPYTHVPSLHAIASIPSLSPSPTHTHTHTHKNNADCTVLDVDGNFAYDNAEREEIRALLLQHMMFNGELSWLTVSCYMNEGVKSNTLTHILTLSQQVHTSSLKILLTMLAYRKCLNVFLPSAYPHPASLITILYQSSFVESWYPRHFSL